MRLNKNRNRKWIEQLAVAAIKALNVADLPHTKTVLYARLWHWPGDPWTISALADATRIDKASVREHIKNFPEDYINRTDDGILLTPAGEREAYRMTKRFYRAIEPRERLFIKRFFSTKYAGQLPYRKKSEFFADLDRCNRHVTSSIAFRTVLSTMDLQSRKVSRWTISQLAEETAFSYQAVYKVLNLLVEQGLVAKRGKSFSITSKGKVRCVAYFFTAVRWADMRLLKILFEMSLFHNPPHK